nr:DUF2536 family protein [Anoxybacillus flavithermus]
MGDSLPNAVEVHHVSYQMQLLENGKRLYSAIVHFKAKK